MSNPEGAQEDLVALPRLYADLAWAWELMVAQADYWSEAEFVASALAQHLRGGGNQLLDVGCGAGHHDAYLNQRFQVTGLDLSPAMLELARRRNPEVPYHLGDMRAFRLNRQFDAVVVLDAIAYNTAYADLERTLRCCRDHLKPDGVLLFFLEEAFSLKPFRRDGETLVSTYRQGETELVLVERLADPDPGDTHYEHTFVYLIRCGDAWTMEIDRHQMGLYELGEVERRLDRLGFRVHRAWWPFGGEGGLGQGPLFICRKT